MSALIFEPEYNPQNNIGDIVGPIGSTLALFFFLTPGVLMYSLHKRTVEPSKVPYVIMMANIMNCVLWFAYGLQIKNLSVWLCNMVGGILNLIWISIFWCYFFQKLAQQFFTIVGTFIFTGAVFAIFYYAINIEIVSGITACVFNVIMYAAPGQNTLLVIKTKNYTLIPFSTTLVGLLCSIDWLLFGLIGMQRMDYTIIIPNGLGNLKFLIFRCHFCHY